MDNPVAEVTTLVGNQEIGQLTARYGVVVSQQPPGVEEGQQRARQE